jgi:hypothetical protein
MTLTFSLEKEKKFQYFLIIRILTAREKRLRQKFHSETEFQAYEKRLKDVEKKIRLLVKRGKCIFALLTE